MVLTESEFVRALAHEFADQGMAVTPESDLFDELALDSLATFRLVIWIEDLAGVLYPELVPEPFFDVRGAYAHYLRLAHQPTGRYA